MPGFARSFYLVQNKYRLNYGVLVNIYYLDIAWKGPYIIFLEIEVSAFLRSDFSQRELHTLSTSLI